MASLALNANEIRDASWVGPLACAPMTDAVRAPLPELQRRQASLETPEAMHRRAAAMFLRGGAGLQRPADSEMLPVRVVATNALLELVQTTAHKVWVASEAEIKVNCPTLWDEELLFGWLLLDALNRWPVDEDTARAVGK